MRIRNADTKEQLKKVHDLYEEAFPKSEKKPFRMILEGREKGNQKDRRGKHGNDKAPKVQTK